MKVLIVWGFLGSGKTTFINYLLKHKLQDKRVVVIENESGKASVDGRLLQGNNAEIVDLISGCVCCTLRSEMANLMQKLEKESQADMVILEPSGLSSLEELLKIPGLDVTGTITMIDVSMYNMLMKLNPLYYRRQFSLSSVVLLTKSETVAEDELNNIVQKIQTDHPTVKIVTDYRQLTDVEWNELTECLEQHAEKPSSGLRITPPTFATNTLKIESPIDALFFQEDFPKINQLFGAPIIRAKGLLQEEENKELVFNMVGDMVTVEPVEASETDEGSFITYWSSQNAPVQWLNTFVNSEEISCEMDDLVLSDDELFRYMGFKGSKPTSAMLELINRIKSECIACCVPRLGWRFLTARPKDKKHVMVAGTEMAPDYTITRAFRDADFFVSLVASVGKEMNEYIEQKRMGTDIMESFIADAMGSMIVEAVVAYGRKQLIKRMSPYGMTVSNSYSPGYCGWHVSEQQLFFSKLPSQFCGVTLTDSSLMLPIKSVSTLLAVGKHVVEQPYGCDICHRKDCYKKKDVL